MRITFDPVDIMQHIYLYVLLNIHGIESYSCICMHEVVMHITSNKLYGLGPASKVHPENEHRSKVCRIFAKVIPSRQWSSTDAKKLIFKWYPFFAQLLFTKMSHYYSIKNAYAHIQRYNNWYVTRYQRNDPCESTPEKWTSVERVPDFCKSIP